MQSPLWKIFDSSFFDLLGLDDSHDPLKVDDLELDRLGHPDALHVAAAQQDLLPELLLVGIQQLSVTLVAFEERVQEEPHGVLLAWLVESAWPCLWIAPCSFDLLQKIIRKW